MLKLEYLITYLLKENTQIKSMEIPKQEESQKTLFRTLCNIREPRPISKEFLKIQDEYLQEQLRTKNIIHVKDIPTIQAQYKQTQIQNKDKIALWKGDITCLEIGAIVNAANAEMLGCFVPCHNCIDNWIHSQSGIQLRLECNQIMSKGENTKIILTNAYNLPCKYILHAVGPITNGVPTLEQCQHLKNCYQSCLRLAIEHKIRTLAFCSIATGVYQFPKRKAAKIAIETLESVLNQNRNYFDKIVIDVYSEEDYDIYKELLE